MRRSQPAAGSHPQPQSPPAAPPTPQGPGATGKWAVSSQTIGEVLTTDIQGDGLRILVFSTRIDLDPHDLEARVTRLAASALDAAGRESRPRPVPRLLHYTMGEVLGLLNELERASGQPASAVAFYGNELEVSFAYIGGQDPSLEGLSSGTDAPWIRMTYGDLPGGPASGAAREVRGFSLFARANLDIHLRWACAFGAAENQGVEVLATWKGSSDVSITMRNLRVQAADEAPAGPGAAKPESFFAGWFDDLEQEWADDTAGASRHPVDAAPQPVAAPPPVAAAPPPVSAVSPPASDLRAAADEGSATADAGPAAAAGTAGTPGRTWEWPPRFDDIDPQDAVREAMAGPETAEAKAVDPELVAQAEAYEDAAALAAGYDEEMAAYEEEMAAYEQEIAGYEGEEVPHDDELSAPVEPRREPEPDPAAQARFERARAEYHAPDPDLVPVREFLKDPVEYEEPAMEPSPVGDFVAAPAPAVAKAEPEGDDVPWIEAGAAGPATDGTAKRPRRFASPEWATSAAGGGFDGRRAAPWIAGAVVLFALGAWLGIRGGSPRQVYGPGGARTASPLGFAAPRFTVRVTSDPPGASIWIDDQPTTLRTPADVDLKPGAHRVSVGDAESGMVTYDVQGERGRVALHAPLEGSLQVDGPMADSVLVYVDGELRGRAPLRLAGLAPGLHEVEFAAKGQPPRSQTVRVPARGTARLEARPLELPPTGKLEVRAILADGDGSTDVRGAAVYIDGERRGSTPLSLELPRGPHSVRVVNGSEESAIQMIELPGGNLRYANFTLGGGLEPVNIELRVPTGTTPAIVVAAVPEVSRRDLREMWLHVRSPQGVWQRHPMTIRVGSGGPEGVAPFPHAGRAVPWYVSALGPTGEEYFTEIQGRSAPKPAAKRVIPQAVIRPDTSLPMVTETPTP